MTSSDKPSLVLPAAPAIVVHPRGIVWLTADGEVENPSFSDAIRRLRAEPAYLLHRPAVASRLGIKGDPFPALDVLELFAFARPASFCVPTIRGLAQVLDLPSPGNHEQEATCLLAAARDLLAGLTRDMATMTAARRADVRGLAWILARSGWPWATPVLAALGAAHDQGRGAAAWQVWDRLAEWSDHAPEPPPGSQPVEPAEARARLAEMLGEGAEQRPAQADFASAAALAFMPRQVAGAPNVVLAEAGTGTGKTLGYIAPASLWAQKNQGPVWISTYTRNLQRQLDGELDRLFPDPAEKREKW
jgi:ATP-dependent DNA helicase DinG